MREYAACLDMAKKEPEDGARAGQEMVGLRRQYRSAHCVAVALIAQENYVQAGQSPRGPGQ